MLIPAFAYAGPVEEFVKEELSSRLPWDADSLEIDEVEIPGFKTAKGASMKFDMPKRPTGPGKVSFKVEVNDKVSGEKVFWGSARIKVFKDAVVALRPMKGKTRITAVDVKIAKVELNEATEAFFSIDEIEGMVAKRPISAGAVIKKSYVKQEAVIKRGEKVTVNVEGPSIRIRSKGVAASDGHVGSIISVKTASGKEVPGEVAGPGEIVIEF